MITTTAVQSSTDLSFFSKRKNGRQLATPSGSSVKVHTVTRLLQTPSPTTYSSPLSSPQTPPLSKKRSTTNEYSPLSDIQDPSSPPIPMRVKKLRTEENRTAPKKTQRRASTPKAGSSRPSSRNSSPPQKSEHIYRSSRSRSATHFQDLDPPPQLHRKWACEEEGDVGDQLLSSEMVVKRLMKSYKTCRCQR